MVTHNEVTRNDVHGWHRFARLSVAAVVLLAASVAGWWWFLTEMNPSVWTVVLGFAGWLFLVGIVLVATGKIDLRRKDDSRSRSYGIVLPIALATSSGAILSAVQPASMFLVLVLGINTLSLVALRSVRIVALVKAVFTRGVTLEDLLKIAKASRDK